MGSGVKINGVNMFINRFETAEEIINLDTLKQSFYLDDGESGFYKLSLSKKTLYGTLTVNDNYNRPPLGPIDDGLFCQYCDSIGPADHLEKCEVPQPESLYLTLGGFNNYILNNISYAGDYLHVKEAFKNKSITPDILKEIMAIPGGIDITNGSIDMNKNKDRLTTIAYYGIYKKRGPARLAPKTTTTQFLNNLIIFHEEFGHKTSIRVSKNGLINLINVNTTPETQAKFVTELVKRINSSGSVNKDALKEITGSEIYKKIPQYSYIHSASGQFAIDAITKGVSQVNFGELDSFISPYGAGGNLVENPGVTTIVKSASGSDIIILNGIRIIEWEYSLGRVSRHEVMSKEYIKLMAVPADGLKLTVIINKFGAAMLNISKCSVKQIKNGLCGTGNTDITVDLFNPIEATINKLFNDNTSLLVMKTLSGLEKNSPNYNTVSGYAPSGKICRLTRTRDSGNANYKEGMRPDPYSWKGSCPDPNYQYLKPEGVQDKDGLWYPCCETKTKDSIEIMKTYLRSGFPNSQNQINKYNIEQPADAGSGILIPGSNSPGAVAEVNIDGIFESVTVLKKLTKKSNDYTVRRSTGEKIKVNGTKFKRETRVFRGLDSFDRDSLLSCITENLKKFKLDLDQSGKIIKNTITEMNERVNDSNKDIFLSLTRPTTSSPFTHNNINLLLNDVFTLRKISSNSYKFYLVLSPGNNFYINDSLLSLDSEISENFRDTFIFDGYVSFNNDLGKNQYEITDILYYNKPLIEEPFGDRYMKIYETGDLLSSVGQEILIIPDVYNNVIDGSYQVMQASPLNKLIFISDNKTLIYGGRDIHSDTIGLEILNINKQTITFGYDSKEIPENVGLDFLRSYTFNKRDIPRELTKGDYYNIKINRDSNGNVVPNRKINIVDKINKTGDMKNYLDTIDILLVKFNPITSDYFNSDLDWEYKGEILEYDGNTLIQSNKSG